ncbi:MAG: hypothetical protein QGG71_08130, partial [Pirellulaceae bacterium]|nr:hypothetical protein [Pirellulaceae bacterium]
PYCPSANSSNFAKLTMYQFFTVNGYEFSVLEADIDEHRKSPLSIMPDNMSTVLPPADFSDMVKYLLSLRQPAKKTASKPEP